jgi:hypothetical protein
MGSMPVPTALRARRQQQVLTAVLGGGQQPNLPIGTVLLA